MSKYVFGNKVALDGSPIESETDKLRAALALCVEALCNAPSFDTLIQGEDGRTMSSGKLLARLAAQGFDYENMVRLPYVRKHYPGDLEQQD